jgi:hypothetical protein
MTLLAIALVLALVALAVGAALALTSTVIRGDGLTGPGRAPEPPRSHHADLFEPSLRRLL